MDHAQKLAANTKVSRVLVNHAHSFGNGGGLSNALPFTLSAGCGSWAANSISENLSIENFVNKTVPVHTHDKQLPQKTVAFGDSMKQVWNPKADLNHSQAIRR